MPMLPFLLFGLLVYSVYSADAGASIDPSGGIVHGDEGSSIDPNG